MKYTLYNKSNSISWCYHSLVKNVLSFFCNVKIFRNNLLKKIFQKFDTCQKSYIIIFYELST